MTRWIGVLLLLVNTGSARADQAVWKDYVIHYTTLSSMLIPPDVARSHDIIRSDDRVVTNIAIRRGDRPVKAHVGGTVTNLLNQLFVIDFREVSEQDAIYYLASNIVDERDTLRFDLQIRPQGEIESFNLTFLRSWH